MLSPTPWGVPASISTNAGPTACQAFGIENSTWSTETRRAAQRATLPSTSAAAVSSGTVDGGSNSSIGTRITYVGTTYPAPSGNLTAVATSAYSPTSRSASQGSTRCAASAGAASGPATARNSTAAEPSTTSSRRLARCVRDSHDSSSRRSTGSLARASSSWLSCMSWVSEKL